MDQSSEVQFVSLGKLEPLSFHLDIEKRLLGSSIGRHLQAFLEGSLDGLLGTDTKFGHKVQAHCSVGWQLLSWEISKPASAGFSLAP